MRLSGPTIHNYPPGAYYVIVLDGAGRLQLATGAGSTYDGFGVA